LEKTVGSSEHPNGMATTWAVAEINFQTMVGQYDTALFLCFRFSIIPGGITEVKGDPSAYSRMSCATVANEMPSPKA
jgi:hypothetical protein